jgi:rapamycin-insensitive companion of mTOR
MGELAKTAPGTQYLKNKKTMEYFVENIEKSESPLRIRACLWALGQLGSSSLGMELIKQYNVIDILIRMSYNHNYISLRGSCRYILNMLCASAEGRKEIVKQGWLTNRNSNIGWICVPPVSTKFFKIDKAEDNYWAANTQYWTDYNSSLEPLNDSKFSLIVE